MHDADPPLILLPGMTANADLFRFQREAFPTLRTPDWIEPGDREPLPEYARRLAQVVDPGERCVVGGASFGGMVALEMATHLPAEACLHIASVRSGREFPRRFRAARPVASLGPDGMGRLAGNLAPFLPGRVADRMRRLSHPDSAFLRWASWAALTWRPSAGTSRVRVFQIHGSADRTFPVRFTRPDVVVEGAGHVLPLTHPEEVNAFLRRHLVPRGEPDGPTGEP